MEAKSLGAGSVRKRARPWRVLWYVSTAIAAGAALFVEPALAAAGRRGAVPPVWMFVPIGIFCLLFGGDAVERWRRVQLGRYPAGPALLRTLFGLVFASVLLSSTISDYRAQRPQGIDRLLDHPDSEVRATAIYALGFRDPNADRARRVLIKVDDRAPEVRQAALEVLSRWSGRPAADLPGIRAWAVALSGSSTVTEGTAHP